MDTSRFIICRAAAGSGKTHTLVYNYLLLAFSAKGEELKKRFGRILAITFTNKAANEMKERILRELDGIARLGTESPMGHEIAEATRMDDTTLRAAATTVRQSILHNYSDFAVCTIDSFVHHIVRTFAHELGLPMNFNVYIDNSDLIQNAIEELMALVGSDGEGGLTQVLCDYADSRMAEGKSYMIERDLTELCKELFKERTPEYLKGLDNMTPEQFRQIHREMTEANRDYERRLQQIGREAVATFTEAGLCEDDFFHGKTGAGTYLRKVANGEPANANQYVTAYFEGDKLGCAKCTKNDVLADLKPRLQEYYRQITQLKETEEVKYNTRRLLLRNLYALALINKLNELVGRYSAENEIVHISEFNKRISQIVQEEPAPFIYERIGNRYYNYLIDEFQDTSRMQWQNLVPLVENGVGSGHTSMVVGDGKQAIYRFRQGDVDQFIALPHVDSPLHGAIFQQPGVSTPTRLDQNWRSARTVVEFNNAFFEWAIRNRFDDNEELRQIYLGDSPVPDLVQTPKREGGFVQVGFWDIEEHAKLWQEMVADIESLIREKGYEYRDIAILARNNRTLAEISTYLTANGIPIVSSESLLLTQSRVVMLMRSLLQYLLDGNDRVATARVLLYLHSLDKLKSDHSDAFIDNPKAVDIDAIAQSEGLWLDCERLRRLNLYDCCEEALRMLGIEGTETAYTATWLNIVAKYTNSHQHDLGEFLEWFDQEKERLSTNTASDLNAVRLMSIHKAKGLESPIVMLPLLNSSNKKDSIWVHIAPDSGMPLPTSLVQPKKEEHTLFDAEYDEESHKCDMDDVNVLYVALTRPREQLLIYSQSPKKSGTKDYPSLLQDYMSQRSDAATGRPGTLTIGESSPKVSKPEQEKGESTTNKQIDSVTFPDWASRIAIAEQSAFVFGELDESSVRRGNQIHELLATIRHSGEASDAVADYIVRNRIADAEASELKSLMDNMLGQNDVARFFNPQYEVKNECDIAWHGNVLRPDRIVLADNETWVVDFKTGMPKAEHRLQVERYCTAVHEMGYPDVKGYLLYIGRNGCQVIPCQ